MRQMQDLLTEKIEQALDHRDLAPVRRGKWANTGHIFGMNDALDTVVLVKYDFQDTYCSIIVEDHATSRFNKWNHLDYVDGTRLREMLAFIRGEDE